MPIRLLFHDRFDPTQTLAHLRTPKLMLYSAAGCERTVLRAMPRSRSKEQPSPIASGMKIICPIYEVFWANIFSAVKLA